jgi:uncharacterized protein (TIGR02646 family)
MRPVTKWQPGEQGTTANYNPYGGAKEPLRKNLGDYCSYCESPVQHVSLEVEHIVPKDLHPDVETRWSNFLLGCKNCNTVKGKQDVNLTNYHFPHIQNTLHSFVYKTGGLVVVNDKLPPSERAKAEETYKLVGLGRRPGGEKPAPADKRWEYRFSAYKLATRFREKYINQESDTETIVALARANGYWSVWMSVFQSIPEVTEALIRETPGTFSNCLTTDIYRL